MPFVTADGIRTHYRTIGTGPPILMFSPGGFGANMESWSTQGRYRDLKLIETLSESFTCIVFDRREAGRSGGRIEPLRWASYVDQATGLLDAIGVDCAFAMGGCVGCSSAAGLALAAPSRVRALVLFSPAGGPRYRMAQHRRFALHRGFVAEHGMSGVVELALSTTDGFSQDSRVGPWVEVIRSDDAFAEQFAAFDAPRYDEILGASARLLFDRDTVPGVEAEDLMGLTVPVLIVPGEDRSHAPSAARFLQECVSDAEYWDVPVADQHPSAARGRILQFLGA